MSFLSQFVTPINLRYCSFGTPTSLTANTYTSVYTAPASNAIVTINVVNTSYAPVSIRIAISTGTTPNIEDYIEYEAVLTAANNSINGNVLERSDIIIPAGKSVVVYSNLPGVVVRVYGFGV